MDTRDTARRWILTGPAEYAEEIKRSRFIARAAPAETVEAAMSFLAAVREPAASHNCWAYRLGQAYRFSDDGEPGGTAGKPILAAIERADLDRLMVVVTRYFGGIKLGAGGLSRAYGGVAGACLRAAAKREWIERVDLAIQAGFESAAKLHPLLGQFGAEKLSEDYDAAGLTLVVRLPAEAEQAFAAALRDLSRGAIRIRPLKQDRPTPK